MTVRDALQWLAGPSLPWLHASGAIDAPTRVSYAGSCGTERPCHSLICAAAAPRTRRSLPDCWRASVRLDGISMWSGEGFEADLV